MISCNELSVNRKLLDLRETGQSYSNHETKNSHSGDFAFNSMVSKIGKCCYFDEPFSLNSTMTNISNNHKTISLFHVNIRSLSKLDNFHALIEFLTSPPFSPDVVCVSETRFKGKSSINVSIANYD